MSGLTAPDAKHSTTAEQGQEHRNLKNCGHSIAGFAEHGVQEDTGNYGCAATQKQTRRNGEVVRVD